MFAQAVAIFVPIALLAAAAAWDVASFTIPNSVSAALAAAFVLFSAAAGIVPGALDLSAAMTPAAIGFHALAGIAGLVAGIALFAFGVIGGGDAKLFAAIALWLGFGNLFAFALCTSLIGGALAFALLSVRQFPIPALLLNQGWAMRLHDSKAGIPYGVALAIGATAAVPLGVLAEGKLVTLTNILGALVAA